MLKSHPILEANILFLFIAYKQEHSQVHKARTGPHTGRTLAGVSYRIFFFFLEEGGGVTTVREKFYPHV